MNKTNLYAKLAALSKSELRDLNISKEELHFIKTKLVNYKIGLKLDFIEKDVDFKLRDNYYVFNEIKNLSISPNKSNNHLLIESDNYEALKALEASGKKVDVVYIDPPYNTGREFVYSDSYETEKATVGQDDPYKHSKWLSFMKKRLRLAKRVMSEDASIWVSIDDNEQAYLKVLMDEIFGENNFVGNISRKTRGGGGYSGKNIGINHDYLIVYKKNLSPNDRRNNHFMELKKDGSDDEKYRKIQTFGAEQTREDRPTMFYEIDFNGKTYLPKLPEGSDGRWGFSKLKIEEMLSEERIIEKAGTLYYLEKASDYKIIETINREFENKFSNGKGTNDYKSLKMHDIIPADQMRPKPVGLIKFILEAINKPDALVLDFFAGSGTTGQAVLEANKNDNGSRRFILITNNERNGVDINKNPEKGIARAVTRERLLRVVSGFSSNGQKITEGIKGIGIKYLKVAQVHKTNGEFEDIDDKKDLYEEEFGTKDFSIENLERV